MVIGKDALRGTLGADRRDQYVKGESSKRTGSGGRTRTADADGRREEGEVGGVATTAMAHVPRRALAHGGGAQTISLSVSPHRRDNNKTEQVESRLKIVIGSSSSGLSAFKSFVHI